MALFDCSFFLNSNLDVRRRPGIKSKVLDGSEKLAEPSIPQETTDSKIKKKKVERQELLPLIAG